MGKASFGDINAGLNLQPGWSIRVTDEGVMSSRCRFRCDAKNMENLIPRRGTPHPKNNKLQSMAAEGVVGVGEVAMIDVDYIGLLRDPSDVRFQFIGAMSSNPIETHPRFSEAEGEGEVIAGTPEAPANGAKFDDEGNFLGFPSNEESRAAKLVGVTNYLSPGATYRATFYTAKPSLFKFKDAGTRTLSPIGFPQGVTLPIGCEWLVLAPLLEQMGTIYKITQDYQLSGPNGVNRKIYDWIS